MPLIDRLVGLSRLRVLRPITGEVQRLIDEVRAGSAPASPSAAAQQQDGDESAEEGPRRA